jgi:NAD-dependent DNA ligase
LKFFEAPDASDMSADEAWEARSAILADPAKKERWHKYVYLTHDLDSRSPELMPFDPAALEAVILPEGYTAAKAEREHREQTAARILATRELYDEPEPVLFEGRVFIFTGVFEFGTRERCERAVRERGGLVIPRDIEVSHLIDYLVVGSKGSARWKREGYGAKIETAVVERHIHGKPAIVKEEHWRSYL